jgi:uncharacterized protein (DUF427 family)
MIAHVTVEPQKHIKVTLNGELVAESERGYVVHEQGLPARFYVPRADVCAELSEGTGAGVCLWKGRWRHLDVSVGGKRVASGAWTYYETKPATEPTRDLIAFYDSKFSVKTR